METPPCKNESHRDDEWESLLVNGYEASRRNSFAEDKKPGFYIARSAFWLCALNIIVFGLSMTALSVTISSKFRSVESSQDTFCSSTSPVFRGVNISTQSQQMDGSLLDLTHSIYRQEPSDEVDDAWMDLENQYSIWVTSEEVIRSGKDPANVAKFPPSFNLGPDAYAAEMDVYHKIHCLDYLRRHVHSDYYYGGETPDKKTADTYKAHIGHCLSMLLQHLMCDANTEIVTKYWIKGVTHPFQDFSVNRQCRDFKAVQRWADSRKVPNEAFYGWRKPDEVVGAVASDEFLRLFGSKDSNATHHD